MMRENETNQTDPRGGEPRGGDQLPRLRRLLEPPVEALGYELFHLELTADGGGRILRLYIDAPGGIRVDDCEAVSRQVGALLDVEDADADAESASPTGAYQLEVSSPGLDRPLVTPAHFQRYAGQRALIRVRHAAVTSAGARRLVGELHHASEDSVVLDVDGERHQLAYADIETARLQPSF